MAWLDRDLVVRSRYGRLIDFITEGRPVTDSVPPLIGLEDDIRALENDPDGVVDLPAVALAVGERITPRLNISIYWFGEAGRHLMLVSRAFARSDLEAQLMSQMRGRQMAEAQVAAKSRELARANAELSRANADLENFASIIAHDLSGPMRALRYTIDDLERSLAQSAAETVEPTGTADPGATAPAAGPARDDPGGAHATLAKLRTQTGRLSSMLRGLYDYSSIGRKQDAIEPVDTRALIDSVVATIHRPAGFTLAIDGTWPTLETLAAPLDLVLRNLIENAVKHHDRDTGSIRATAADHGAYLLVTIADDGPGIAAASQDAVFLPFRTLGQPGAGTGMGLAFVRRTIEAVGGALQLISNPHQRRGTEFRLLWPKQMAP